VIVACVLRSGGRYNSEWVDRLHRGVRANWDLPYPLRFVCVSDLKWQAAYERHDLQFSFPGWWSKIELFTRHWHFHAPTLYLDLDTIITGPMSNILARPMKTKERGFRVMRDPYTGTLQSAAMRWTGQWMTYTGHLIASEFLRRPYKAMDELRYGGDQAFIREVLLSVGKDWSYFTPAELMSYRAEWQVTVDPVTTAVQLHGDPKPDELPDGHELKRKWIDQ
jgi:hypothetical protein